MNVIKRFITWVFVKKNNGINKYDNYKNETRGMYLLNDTHKEKLKRKER